MVCGLSSYLIFLLFEPSGIMYVVAIPAGFWSGGLLFYVIDVLHYLWAWVLAVASCSFYKYCCLAAIGAFYMVYSRLDFCSVIGTLLIGVASVLITYAFTHELLL